MHPELQQLDLESVLAHVPTPLVVLQVGTGAALYANRAARRLPFAYRELEGWRAVDQHGAQLTGPWLPHRAASRGEAFERRIVHFVSETGRYSLKFHCHGLGGDTCVLAFEDVTRSESMRANTLIADADVEELASSRCPAVVVENLLDANRIRAGAFALDLAHGALADAAADARVLLGEHAAAMDLVIEDRGEGAWDRPRMARVIANLVLDAIDRGGGRIEVTVARLGAAIELRVRGNRTLVQVARQSLGMFIVKEIVAAHRGTQDVRAGVYRLVLPGAQ